MKTISITFLLACFALSPFSLASVVIDYPDTKPGVSFSAIQSLPTSHPTEEESYATESLQYGELWLPEGSGPFPIVVFIHGGCWLNSFDVKHTHPASTALAQAGYAVWALEYRRVGDPGGGWPGTFDDISLGIDHVLELAEKHPLDINHVHLVGHSAGGHLALWAAGRETASEKSTSPVLKVASVVALAGIADLETYSSGTSSCERVVVRLMGGTPAQQPERYQRASPLNRLPVRVRTTLIQGTADRIVPMSQARTYYDAAKEVDGARTSLRPIAGAGHFDLIHPGTGAWRQLLEALAE